MLIFDDNIVPSSEWSSVEIYPGYRVITITAQHVTLDFRKGFSCEVSFMFRDVRTLCIKRITSEHKVDILVADDIKCLSFAYCDLVFDHSRKGTIHLNPTVRVLIRPQFSGKIRISKCTLCTMTESEFSVTLGHCSPLLFRTIVCSSCPDTFSLMGEFLHRERKCYLHK